MVAEFRYTCVDCYGKKLRELEHILDHAREITYRTFARHIDPDFLKDMNQESGIHLSRDWAVRFYKSWLPNRTPVYFMDHSAIEHVFY